MSWKKSDFILIDDGFALFLSVLMPEQRRKSMTCNAKSCPVWSRSCYWLVSCGNEQQGRLYLSLSGVEEAIVKYAAAKGDSSLKAAMASQSVVQLGLLMTLPMIMEEPSTEQQVVVLWSSTRSLQRITGCIREATL
ncbi:hypothetical protein F2Q70_00042675 [Brassica cretica]|uniref:Uncharacterized protein n=1 Tax=Brassica cretica TaxID=69181 RepID=A0A8S9KLV8_BRACR|nr:hypothetical protein F2Q70_00042675 [Brassica cretica]KAF2606488.1 hypothetical protein F2Q68_00043493 [Brassica cretica]